MKRRRNPSPSDWREAIATDYSYDNDPRYVLVWYNDERAFRLDYIHAPRELEKHMMSFEWGPLDPRGSHGIPLWHKSDHYSWEATPFDPLRIEPKYMKYIGMGNYMLLQQMHKRMIEVLPEMMKLEVARKNPRRRKSRY